MPGIGGQWEEKLLRVSGRNKMLDFGGKLEKKCHSRRKRGHWWLVGGERHWCLVDVGEDGIGAYLVLGEGGLLCSVGQKKETQ